MLTIPHVLVGASVATLISQVTPNPIIQGLGAVASHFLMDMVPHLDVPPSAQRSNGELIWSPRIWAQVIIDNGVALVGVIWLWMNYFGYPAATPFIIGAFGGFLPDLIDNVPLWKSYLRRLPGFKQFHRFHEWTHHTWISRYPMSGHAGLGIITQVIAVGLSIWYLF